MDQRFGVNPTAISTTGQQGGLHDCGLFNLEGARYSLDMAIEAAQRLSRHFKSKLIWAMDGRDPVHLMFQKPSIDDRTMSERTFCVEMLYLREQSYRHGNTAQDGIRDSDLDILWDLKGRLNTKERREGFLHAYDSAAAQRCIEQTLAGEKYG